MFVGLWNRWRDPDGEELYTFTIITTDANKLLRPIHDRMPLILDPLVARQWLDPTAIEPCMISVVMVPFPSDLMGAYEVSCLVNDPKNDSPACIDPAIPEPPGPLFSRILKRDRRQIGFAEWRLAATYARQNSSACGTIKTRAASRARID
jgi:putative SOS response-associated peptidase YedK